LLLYSRESLRPVEFDETISEPGDTFEWEADEAGRQDYYCSPHAGFMFGSVDVV